MAISLRSTAFGAACTLVLATAGLADAGAGELQHRHEHGNPQAATAAKHSGKWATDQVLRTSMEDIRQAMDAGREGIDHERFAAADYQRLAGVLDGNIANIVKNCHLEPKADTAFHETVLKDLSWGSEMMRASPKVEARRAGALAVRQALRNYGEYFEHPGWSNPR